MLRTPAQPSSIDAAMLYAVGVRKVTSRGHASPSFPWARSHHMRTVLPRSQQATPQPCIPLSGRLTHVVHGGHQEHWRPCTSLTCSGCSRRIPEAQPDQEPLNQRGHQPIAAAMQPGYLDPSLQVPSRQSPQPPHPPPQQECGAGTSACIVLRGHRGAIFSGGNAGANASCCCMHARRGTTCVGHVPWSACLVVARGR